MKSITRHTGTLHFIARDKSSYYGNPRFIVMLDGYTCKTAPDSQLGYSIQNHFGKKVSAHIGLHYGVITIENVKRI